jgi:hypothetical protein
VEFFDQRAMLSGTCGDRLLEPGVEKFRSFLGAGDGMVWRDHVYGATVVCHSGQKAGFSTGPGSGIPSRNKGLVLRPQVRRTGLYHRKIHILIY